MDIDDEFNGTLQELINESKWYAWSEFENEDCKNCEVLPLCRQLSRPSVNKHLLEDLCSQSMVALKDKLARKYEGNSSRKTFSEDNLWKHY